MTFKQVKNSYNAGELSEYMAGRTDINKYHNGCSKLINATVLPHGGVTKRSGTEYIALTNKASGAAWVSSTVYAVGDIRTNSGETYICLVAHTSGTFSTDLANGNWVANQVRLVPFEFSVTDALVLEFSHLKLRFYKSGDRIMNTSVDVDDVTLPSGSEVQISTDGAHGLSTGDTARFADLGGTVELNFNGNHTTEFVVTVVDADDLTLDGTDGDDFTAWTSGGTLASIVEITTVFTSEQVFEFHYTQSADVMYIAQDDHPPQKLSRTSDTSWTIADIVFSGGPFIVKKVIAADLMGFARTGGTGRSEFLFPAGATGTLTATGGHTPFLGTANDIGTLWLLKHARPDATTSTFAKDTNIIPTLTTFASGAIRTKGDFNMTVEPVATGKEAQLWRKQGEGGWTKHKSFRGATSFSSTEDEDDVLYAMTRSDNTINGTFTAQNQIQRGVVKVTAASSTTVVTVIVVDPVLSDNSTDNAVTTSMWAEGAWGLFRGYPRTVTFFEDRLWWASSANNPDTLWGSRSSLYENMSFTDLGLDDEAVTFPFNDNEVSQIQWMVARQVMAVGAANKEYRFGASDIDKPITPLDRKVTPQTSFGSDNIQPVILNDAIFFFQRQGRKLRAMKFDAITENFQSDDATLLANTLLESQPTTMAVQRVPDSIIWITRTDGVLLSFTYEPDEEIAGWARHMSANSTGVETPVGFYESVAIIHGLVEDEVWVSVKRTINSTTSRYIERFSTRFFDQVDEAQMLDSAVIVASIFDSQEIILASDTVRCNNGLCNSSLCGGVAS